MPSEQRARDPDGQNPAREHGTLTGVRVAKVSVKRVYDDPTDSDGTRVLVDRLWPRGMSKERAHLDQWLKAVAPTTELRTWYSHDSAKWEDFQKRYESELHDNPDQAAAFNELEHLHNDGRLTLLTASKVVEHSEAQVLAQLLNSGR